MCKRKDNFFDELCKIYMNIKFLWYAYRLVQEVTTRRYDNHNSLIKTFFIHIFIILIKIFKTVAERFRSIGINEISVRTI
jgi:hypothetical protein